MKIEELGEENARLNRKLSEWRDQAATELDLKHHAKKEANQLRVINHQLQKKAHNNTITTDYFRRSVLKYTHMLNTVLSLLKELRTEMSLGDSELSEDMILSYQKSSLDSKVWSIDWNVRD